MKVNNPVAMLAASCCIMALATPAEAQQSAASTLEPNGSPAAQEAQGEGLEEIIVTAQRRTENLQDVPIAISAFNAEQLDQAGVTSAFELRAVVPTLNIVNGNGVLSTTLRGITATGVSSGFESPIAIYIDGVYLGSGAASFLNFNNIAQIEVAKGPQGTLFGRNATAGSIQITTRTPSQSFAANGDVSYANYDTVTGNLYASGGIAPSLAADIAVYGQFQGDGWGKHLLTGKDNFITHHNVALRSKWVLDAGENTRFTLIGDYADFSNTRSASILRGAIPRPPVTGFPRQPYLGYDTTADVKHDTSGWNGGVSLRLDQDLGSVDLVSVTAYRKSKYRQIFDLDAVSAPTGFVTYVEPASQISEDLQLASKKDGKFSWIAGLSYFGAKTAITPQVLHQSIPKTEIITENHQRTDAFAGYVQGTYEVTDSTRVTLGGRYTSEKRKLYNGNTSIYLVPAGILIANVPAADQKTTFNKFTFKASLDHRFSPDVLAYASFNQGFKSGGYNTTLPGVGAFKPETADAYEIGLKTELFDRHLRFNVAGYYSKYKNIQTKQSPSSDVVNIANAAAARIYGVEIDFEALLADGLRVFGGMAVQSSKYTSFPLALFGNYDGLPNVFGSAEGHYLPLTSKLTSNVAFDYTMAGPAGGELSFGGNAYYNDGYYLGSDNLTRQRSFVELGGQIKWTSADRHLSVTIFGRNLTDNRNFSFSSSNNVVEYAPPRTYGIRAGFAF